MANSKKWSEQALIEQPLMTQDENGNDVQNGTQNVLQVCISGLDLYRKEFKEDKYRGQNKLQLPFDFVVIAGTPCPRGKFFEMEYTIGEYGVVYRALIQAVNPVSDIPFIVGTLKDANIIPKDLTPSKAWLRSDIDAVAVGRCSKMKWEDDDKEGEPTFSSGLRKPEQESESIWEYCERLPMYGACLEYYRSSDCREVWTNSCGRKSKKYPPVFICGSDNVNDPAFAQQRAMDIDDMNFHIEEALQIARDYNIPFFSLLGQSEGDTIKEYSNVNYENLLKMLYGVIDMYRQRQSLSSNL